MSDVVVFDLFGLLQLVDKYPCGIPQQCSLFSESVFVLHPFLFFALVVFAFIGLFVVFDLIGRLEKGELKLLTTSTCFL